MKKVHIPRFLEDPETFELVSKLHQQKINNSNHLEQVGRSMKRGKNYMSNIEEIKLFLSSNSHNSELHA